MVKSKLVQNELAEGHNNEFRYSSCVNDAKILLKMTLYILIKFRFDYISDKYCFMMSFDDFG